ncbi:hypothetical protein ACFP8W_00655, partial [Nocardioides hankookensis]
MRLLADRARSFLPRFLITLLVGALVASLGLAPAHAAGEDGTPPTLTITPGPNVVWHGGPVTYHVKATDGGQVQSLAYTATGADSRASANLDPVNGGDVTFGAKGVTRVLVTAADKSGNQAHADFEVRIDLEDPTVSLGLTEGEVYTKGSVETVGYSCDDPGSTSSPASGIASCQGDVVDGGRLDTSTIGAHTFTVVARDKAGRSSTKKVSYTVKAATSSLATLPDDLITNGRVDGVGTAGTTLTASYTISRPPADLSVEVIWSRDDEMIDGATGPTYVVRAADLDHTVSAQAVATRPGYPVRAYDLGSVDVVDGDVLAPVVKADPDPIAGWLHETVTYHLSATDDRPHDTGVSALGYELSGVTQGSGDLDPAEGGDLSVENEGVTRVLATALDGAGNNGRIGFDVRIDMTDPTVTVSTIQPSYGRGQQVRVVYSCGDLQSGIKSCVGDVPSGGLLDTSLFGEHSFTVTATDNSGLTTIRKQTYQVGVGLQEQTPAKITGSGKVGMVLVGTAPTFVPEATSVCRWFRDGDPITAEGVDRYTTRIDDVDKTVTYRCVSSRELYVPVDSTSEGLKILPGSFDDDLITDARVDGTGAVGSTLTASYTLTDPPANLVVTTFWLRDGVAIDGANKPTYVVRAADFGHTLSARAWAQSQNYPSRFYDLGSVDIVDGDVQRPVVTVTPEPSELWLRGAATYRFSATDDGPGDTGVGTFGYELTGDTQGSGDLDPAGGDVTVENEGVTLVVATAIDRAGNSGGRGVFVRIDLTDPTLNLSAIEANYDREQQVKVTYSCSDLQSGIKSCVGDVPSGSLLDTSLFGKHTFTVTATDNSGRTTTRKQTYQVGVGLQELTPATILGSGRVGEELVGIAPVFTPEATSSCQWFRDGNAIAPDGVDRYTPVDDDLDQTLTYRCVSSREQYVPVDSTSEGLKVLPSDPTHDLLAPVVTADPEPIDGWLRAATTYHLSAIDDRADDTGVSSFGYVLSGVTDGSGDLDVAGGGDVTIENEGVTHVVATATDGAGNEGVKDFDVRVDLTDPTVTLSEIEPSYERDQQVVVSYSCADVQSGVESCEGDVADGDVLDTSTLGEHTFTVTATDRSGRTTTRKETYQVGVGLQQLTPPTVAGSGKVGEELVGTAPTFEPEATSMCQWFRDGAAITDVSVSYTPVPIDIDTALTYRCVSSREGYVPVTSASEGVTVLPGEFGDDFVTNGAVAGVGEIGATLTASYTIIDQPNDLGVEVIWLRDGEVIEGATGLTYDVRPDDLGHTVRAVAVVTRPGYTERRYPLGSVDVAPDSGDVLAPVVTADPEPIDGWLRAATTYHLSAIDDRADDTGVSSFGYVLSGVTDDSGDLDVAAGGDVTIENEGVTNVVATATDGAGNEGLTDFDVRIDLTDPEIWFLSPLGGSYPQGYEVELDYTCSDNQSGVESCVGDVPSGGMLDTSTIGEHVFNVVAIDSSGRRSVAAVAYEVYGELQQLTPPTTAGSGKVGEELVGTAPTYDPEATSICQWYRDGVWVEGEGVDRYTPVAEDLDATLTYACFSFRDQYETVYSVSGGVTVLPGDLADDLVTNGAVAGVGEIGATLTASYTIVDPPADLGVEVIWLRDGEVIEGATGLTYDVRPDDLSHTVRAVAVVTRPGYVERRYPLGRVDIEVPEPTAVTSTSVELSGDSTVVGGQVLTAAAEVEVEGGDAPVGEL